MQTIHVGLIVGSARKEAFSNKIAKAVCALLPPTLNVTPIQIDKLPMFNQDYDDEGRTPAEWESFRETVGAQNAFLFVTPEYNRSFPPVLKNALDIASRPYGQSKWDAKPGAVISVSPGGMGGFGANHHLRQVLAFLNVYTMQQPEAYIGNVTKILDNEGGVSAPEELAYLQSLADAFAAWVTRFYPQ